MDFHKLVIIGVPHMMPNNDQPALNKPKAVSFKHITGMIKNFDQLCVSLEHAPAASSPTKSLRDEEGSFDEEESGRSGTS